MGQVATAITAADFVTPPPWREQRRLAPSAAGRLGGVRLELAAGPDGTRVRHAYQQVPLRVLPPFRLGPGQPALFYLLNPTAGLLDGDGQLVDLCAGSGTRAVVVGQSATRIHPSVGGFCTQQWRLRVQSGAVLAVLPGPAIPFAGCRYYQRVVIDLDEGAGLVWGDLWLAGRYARGMLSERFRFGTLLQDLAVRRAGRLVFRDSFRWEGPWDDQTARWHFGDHLACGSLFLSGRVPGDVAPCPPGVEEACFVTAFGDTCLRWQGPPEAVIARAVRAALGAAAALAGEAGASPWLLSVRDLAPNHWFSPTTEPATPDPQKTQTLRIE